MKKLLLLAGIFAMIGTLSIRAQVTIGADQDPDPSAVLDLRSNGNLGLLLPRVALTDTIREGVTTPAPSHNPVANVAGMFVYNTNTSADGQVVEGVYYNDGSRWWPAGAGGASPWQISATTTKATSNTDNIYQMGQVAIGTDAAADPTAVLNVVSANKGVLLPKVTLTSSTDATTIPNPTKGLLIFNTGANVDFATVGYMYWDGTRWSLFASGTADAAHATLACAGATLSPSITVTGGTAIPAGTLLQISYSVSNGGMFNGATLVSTGNPNVTATIGSNVLMQGNGVLSFLVQGTPTLDQEAPAGLVFDLKPFLDANPGITGCNSVTVGNILTASITSVAVMGYLMQVVDNTGNDNGATGWALSCNSPDGKFSVRVYIGNGTQNIAPNNGVVPNIQLRNNQANSVTIIWNYSTEYGADAIITRSGVLPVPSQQWGANNDNAAGNVWYPNPASPIAPYWGSYWGNPGIYDGQAGNGPEYRRYTWIPLGADNKVSYEVHVMMALDSSTPLSGGVASQAKCYIKFEQVTAQ